VQRQREELSQKLHELESRLAWVRQQQTESEEEKDRFESKWNNYNERWHSLRAHQLELQQEKASLGEQRRQIDEQWAEVRHEQEKGREYMDRISEQREYFHQIEEDLKARQEEVASTESLLEFQKKELHEAVQNVQRKDYVMRDGLAEIEKEKVNLQKMKDHLQTELSGAINAPSYWSGNHSQIRMSWSEAAGPILSMLQRSAVHHSCSGRDGVFNIHEIRKVRAWRVENEVLWKRYQSKMEEVQTVHRKRRIKCMAVSPPVVSHCDGSFPDCSPWKQGFNTACNEVLLWHGTKYANVDAIYKAGMDERVCQLHGMFGAGLYFAESSCKAGQYAERDMHGSSWFFLCRVVLGNPYSTNEGMPQIRRAPDKFDSVVFHPGASAVGHHRELIVYDKCQVYPECIVEACRA
jgi:hypothetical protein